MAARLPLTQTLSPTIRALVKAASNCPVQQPRAISVRYVTPSANSPGGTKTASQTPATGQNYLDVPAHVTKQANISLMQDLHLPTPIQAATEALLTQKAAAILGPLALQALGPGAPQITGPNADGKPEIPLMQPQGAEAGPGGQVPAPAAAQIAPPMGTPGAPVPPDPSQAQGQAPAAPPPPNPMAPAPMAQKAALAALGDLPGQMPGAPAGMGQPGPDVGAGAMGAASPMPAGMQPGGLQAGSLGTGLPPQMPGQAGGPQMPGASAQPSTVPSRMGSSALAPVGLNPLPGTGAPPGGTPARNTPASNPINMYGPISMQGEVNGNAGFGVKNSPVPAKMAGLRETVAARYPSLPTDGVMGLLKSLGLDSGRDGEHFLQTISKTAGNTILPQDVVTAAGNAAAKVVKAPAPAPLVEGPRVGDSVFTGLWDRMGWHGRPGGIFGPEIMPTHPYQKSPLMRKQVIDSISRSQTQDAMAGKVAPAVSQRGAADIGRGGLFSEYAPHLRNMFLDPYQAQQSSTQQWTNPGQTKPLMPEQLKSPGSLLNYSPTAPLHGQAHPAPPPPKPSVYPFLKRSGVVAALRKAARVSAAGEGNIPYIIRPHTESGVEALKLQRYAYKGPRADSLLPPRYPAGDNGVKTTTSAP